MKLTVLDGLSLDLAVVVGDDGGLSILGRDHGALLACMQYTYITKAQTP